MTKILVTVHGAGKQMRDYYEAPLAKIGALLNARLSCIAVYYADIANIGSPVGAAPTAAPAKKKSGKQGTPKKKRAPAEPDPQQVTNFKMAFAMQVQADLNALTQNERARGLISLPGQDIAELLATELNEIVGYLFRRDVYAAIQARMRAGLAQAAADADEIVIASHSFGTVIAFDALRDLGPKYNVSTFLTLGSPLAKLRRMKLRSDDFGGIVQGVREWLNLYDTTDPIANALGPEFPQPGFRLRDVFVDVAKAPLPSHDYFGNAETLAAIAEALK